MLNSIAIIPSPPSPSPVFRAVSLCLGFSALFGHHTQLKHLVGHDNMAQVLCYDDRSPFMVTSRYKEDFVERERLGKGGYGAVFRVCLRANCW
jgi:hypothetical protein